MFLQTFLPCTKGTIFRVWLFKCWTLTKGNFGFSAYEEQNQKICLEVRYSYRSGSRGGKWGWPWAGRLLAASWRVQSVGAAGACLAWWGGRRGKTGRHKIKSNSDTNRTQAYAHTDHNTTNGNTQICLIFDLPNAVSKQKLKRRQGNSHLSAWWMDCPVWGCICRTGKH